MASPHSPGQPVSLNLNHNNNNSSGVKKCGYLRKQKHGHKRFFVLREAGDGCPASRLEYYESEKKWRSKSAAAKRVISLDSCLNINKRADAKNKYLIALYTRDEYFAVAADSEQEQESWYRALTELLSSGRGVKEASGCAGTAAAAGGGCCPGTASCTTSCTTNHLALTEDYGLITPANAVYKEMWQVNLKPRGLGQIKNMTGVYRLCLSALSISFVRLNSETPSATLQLMNIRRCGHSDNYFFVEVGRSASTGPGEIWMQVDDTVVAQSIHETILEAMKAMRELVEFRPRSKSQSSSSNPISVPGRRHHLNQLPPSQTGLTRRTRTDLHSSVCVSAGASSRLRTASEGDNLSNRTVTGSPLSPSMLRAPLSRSHTLSLCGRNSKLVPIPGPLQHSRSMSMPVPRSPPTAASPISLSSGSSSGHGSTSDPLIPPQSLSCSASASGSPSDTGFMSLDEYSSSPGELARVYLNCTSGTPDSASATPPHHGELNGYMSMERQFPGVCPCHLEGSVAEKCARKRTYSLTTPGRQRMAPPQVSSASLDEATLVRATYKGSSGLLSSSPKITYQPYPEDYADVEIGRQEDDGYMPMSHRVRVPSSDYVPMSPASVSAPQQILQPRTCCNESFEVSKEDSPDGYMSMWCGPKSRTVPVHQRLSPAETLASFTPPDYFYMQSKNSCCQTNSVLCQSVNPAEVEPYVMMRSPASPSPHIRIARPSRLALPTLPSMSEHPPESSSPPGGEYIHIYFGETRPQEFLSMPPPSPAVESVLLSVAGSPTSSSSSGSGPHRSSISDYMNLDFCPSSPKLKINSSLDPNLDYTQMSPRKISACSMSDASFHETSSLEGSVSGVQCLTLLMDKIPGNFSLPSPPPDPNRGAKLIRADSQGGRRRHSSETFSSTTQVTPVSPSFAQSPKRHSSASVENVSTHSGDALEAPECGSPMCRETSAGFQNGLNYIAMELSPDKRNLLLLTQASSRGHLPALGLASLDIGSYPSFDFLGHNRLKGTTVRE
ncbi:insulin receptor substrate 2 [Xenopus laevis]|uniref:Insulin receptor substrate 2 n=1 Tax=Xenopus laevis TaxID=8355 RepID=A0A8J0ULA6_XENLA|nr:insulin receptor substrate 2 [Xenopus laevis]